MSNAFEVESGCVEAQLEDFRAAFHQAPAGLGILSPTATGDWLSANVSLCRLLGLPESGLPDRPLGSLLDASDRSLLRECLESLSEGTRNECEIRVRLRRRRKGPRWVDLALASARTRDARPSFVVLSVRDVTRSQSAQVQRDTFFHLSADMHAVVSLDGYLLDVSDAWEKVTGWSREELTNRPYLDFVHPEDRDTTIAEAERLLNSTAKSIQFQNRYICKDGSWRWLEWNSTLGPDGRIYAVARDVSESRRQQREFSQLLDMLPAPCVYINRDETIRYANYEYEQLLGHPRGTLRGRSIAEVLEPGALERVRDQLQYVFRGERRCHEVEARIPGREGMMVRAEFLPHRDDDGEVIGAFSMIHDISQYKEVEATLMHQARHDSLTGLLNRTSFDAALRDAVERCHRSVDRYVVLFIDLDRFKPVNDSCGHAAGDEALRRIAEMMRSVFRKSDRVARIGGDEFAVLLDQCGAEEGEMVARNFLEQLAAMPFEYDRQRFALGASVGLRELDDECDADCVLRQADEACYAAKSRGGGTVVRWEGGPKSIL